MRQSRLLEDAQARKNARTVFDGPMVLRAGAGTGKTAALVARIVAWSLGPGWVRTQNALSDGTDPERIASRTLARIVAITFTEAAAAEMAERVAEALHSVSRGSTVVGLPLDELHLDAETRAAALLTAIDMLQVRTIHAWCRSILSQYPLESGVHPSFRVDADGSETREIIRDIVENGLGALLGSEDPAGFFALLQRGVGPQEIEETVTALVQAGWTGFETNRDPFSQESFEQCRETLVHCCASITALVGDAFVGVRAPNASKILLAINDAQRVAVAANDFDALSSLLETVFPENLRAHLFKAWVKGGGGKAERQVLDQIGLDLIQPAQELCLLIEEIDGIDVVGYQAAARVVQPLVVQAQKELQEKGILAFGDLLRLTKTVLQRAGIADRVRTSMDQLLVDEFQDTDALQCSIVRSIALQGDREKRPGLFIVGDPKQSIYGWRNADLLAYEEFIDDLRQQGANEYRLIQNFRSVGEILDEVDRTMMGLMKPDPGFQPAYESLIPARGSVGGDSAIEHWVSCQWEDMVANPKTSAVDAREIEAQALARDVVRLRSEGTPYSEIGVLFRSMTSVDVYQQALRDAGVPYEVTRDQQYYRRSEVIEAAALIRSILDPMDTLGLVTFLRSAMMQVPDAALMPLWCESFPAHWMKLGDETEALEDALHAVTRAEAFVRQLEGVVDGLDRIRAWADHLRWAVQQVHELRIKLRELSFDQWSHELRSIFLPDLTSAMAYQGVYRLANLEQFFRHLQEHVEERGGDWSPLLRHLREAVKEQLAAEEARPSEAVDAVQLLTIHKSKGLAFTHTYLADMHHRIRSDEREKGTVVLSGNSAQIAGLWPPGIRHHWSKAKKVTTSERVRLLYVGMTRARDRLVFMGMWPTELKDPDYPRTAMDLLVRRQPPLPSPWSLTESLPESSRLRLDGIIWRFPGRDKPSATDVVSAGPAALPELLAVPTERLEAFTQAVERPWTKGPSAVKDGVSGLHSSVSRSDALQAGVAVHWYIEQYVRLGGIAEAEAMAWLERGLELAADGKTVGGMARQRAEQLIQTFAQGELAERLLNSEVLGVELPMLLDGGTDGPVAGWVGSIDLLYVDAESEKVVVADYKTDRVGDQNPLDVSARHAAQGAIYVDAVQRALGLDYVPCFEVWLIETDQRIVVGTPT